MRLTSAPGASSTFSIRRKLRTESVRPPILMLAGSGEESERILGLDLGADDYVTKPYSVSTLLARVRELLRRAEPGRTLPDALRFDVVVADFRSYETTKGGRSAPSPPRNRSVALNAGILG